MASDLVGTEERHSAAPLLTAALSHPREEIVVCTAVGEVDLATGPLLFDQLQKATSDGPRHLVVDLLGITFFSALGAEVLLQTLARQQDGYAMVLVGNSRRVMRVLDVLNLTQRFPGMTALMTRLRPATELAQGDLRVACLPLGHVSSLFSSQSDGRRPATKGSLEEHGG